MSLDDFYEKLYKSTIVSYSPMGYRLFMRYMYFTDLVCFLLSCSVMFYNVGLSVSFSFDLLVL